MKHYIPVQIHLDIKDYHNGQLHVAEKIVRLEEGRPHMWWQIRNTVTGEIINSKSTDEFWTDIIVDASVKSHETIPLNSHEIKHAK